MIGWQFTIQDKRGGSFIINDLSTDPDNFIALQAYPQFDVAIKNNEIDREGQHGIWDFFSYYGRRTVTFQGVIVGSSEANVEILKALMQNVLGFPTQPSVLDDGQVYLRWTDLDSKEWEIECKLSSNIQFSRDLYKNYMLEFNFTLKAAEPFILSQETYTQNGIRGYYNSGGGFPIMIPAIIGVNTVNGLLIDNIGSISAHTVVRIYGEVEGAINNPIIRNMTTGKDFVLYSVLDDETKWIEIDSKEGTVLDQDGTDLSGDVEGASEFLTLQPGVNEILYLSDEDPLLTLYYPSAPFSVAYRQTRI